MTPTPDRDVDFRTGLFAESCWAFIRGERPTMPTNVEFDLHPYLANNVTALIANQTLTRRRLPGTGSEKQQQLEL